MKNKPIILPHLLLVLVCTLLSACGSDDDPTDSPQTSGLLSDIAFTDTKLSECVTGHGLTYVNEATVIVCRNLRLTSAVGIAELTDMTYLDLSDNQLNEIDLSLNTILTSLNLKDNSLTEIDLTLNSYLEYLNVALESCSLISFRRKNSTPTKAKGIIEAINMRNQTITDQPCLCEA